MDVLAELQLIDLLVVLLLAAGVFFGWTGGFIRYALSALAVPVSFVLASQLRVPLYDALSSFWTAFSDPGRLLFVYLVLFIGLLVGLFLAIRAFFRRTRLPGWHVLDELGGAIFGFLFAALAVVFLMLVLDSFYTEANRGQAAGAGWITAIYDGLNGSLLVQVLRDTIVPIAGIVVRPLVPGELEGLLADR